MTKIESKHISVCESNKSANDKLTIEDIVDRIFNIRKTLYKAAGIGIAIGIIVGLSIPKQYTAIVTLSPEMGNSQGNNGLAGLAASFLGNGMATGNSTDALNASLSADIISSTPFLIDLSDVNVITTKRKNYTLDVYLNEQSIPWWNYGMNIPGIVISKLRSIFSNGSKDSTINDIKQSTIELSPEKYRTLQLLKKSIIVSIDKKTSITSISVTLQDPKVAAISANYVANNLQEYISNYRTSKAKEDYIYLEKMYKEYQQEYYISQKKYADYIDSNDNVILQTVLTEQERLQNDMNLAYQVYSQITSQLQIAKAKIQEEKPVFAIVEPAVVPIYSSSIGLKTYILSFMFLAIFCTASWILIIENIWSSLKNKMRSK
ncbi:chain-length determining protein [Parabacteroides sp. APC149_11_2_Y6]